MSIAMQGIVGMVNNVVRKVPFAMNSSSHWCSTHSMVPAVATGMAAMRTAIFSGMILPQFSCTARFEHGGKSIRQRRTRSASHLLL